jgi:hypothetical protein
LVLASTKNGPRLADGEGQLLGEIPTENLHREDELLIEQQQQEDVEDQDQEEVIQFEKKKIFW